MMTGRDTKTNQIEIRNQSKRFLVGIVPAGTFTQEFFLISA